MVKLFITLLSLSLACYTLAQEENKIYNISAKPISDVIIEICARNRIQCIYSSEILKNVESNGLRGSFTVDAALKEVLGESNFSYRYLRENVLTIYELARLADAEVKAHAKLPDKPIKTKHSETKHIETVEVTGSRIPRTDFNVTLPSITIRSDYLFAGNKTNLGSTLESVPTFCESSFSLLLTGLERNIGASFPDLYCLGSQRTLSLINGRRVVPTNDTSFTEIEKGSQFDINVIPTNIIERIDIVGVGGAPIYGSDAIAGTVNIILRDDFEGFELDLEAAQYDEEGGESHKISALYGVQNSSQTSGLVLAYEYHEQRPIQATDRDYTARDIERFPTADGQFIFAENVTIPFSQNPLGTPAPFGESSPFLVFEPDFFEEIDPSVINQFTDNMGNPLSFGEDGRLRPFNFGEQISPSIGQSARQGGEGERTSERLTLQLPIARHSLTVLSNLEINSSLRAFTELQYYQNTSTTRSFFPIQSAEVISLDNPYLNAEDRFTLANNGFDLDEGEFFLFKDWSNLDENTRTLNTQLYRAVVGIEGNFTTLDSSWDWAFSYNRGLVKTETSNFDVFSQRIYDGLNTTRDEQGNIICSVGGDCLPINPFGLLTDQTVIDSITARPSYFGRNEQQVYSVNLLGGLPLLPAGPLSVSAGLVYRQEQAETTPDTFYTQDLGFISPLEAFSGEFSTKEIALETLIPLIGDNSGGAIEALAFEASARFVDHSIAGADTTWTIGAHLGTHFFGLGLLTFKANATEAIRAPSVTESSSRDSVFFDAINESCIDFFGDEDADCLSPLQKLLGEPLKNERSRATSVGFTFQGNEEYSPSIAIDMLSIDVFDLIEAAGFSDNVLGTCDFLENDFDEQNEGQEEDNIEGSSTTETSFSSCIFSASNGFDIFVPRTFATTFQNNAELTMQSIQFSFKQPFSLQTITRIPGLFALSFSGHHLLEYSRLEFPSLMTENSIVDFSGTRGFPELKARAELYYSTNNTKFSWSSHYTSSVENFDAINYEAFWVHNFAAAYRFGTHLELRFGVNNVLNWQPSKPITSQEANGVYAPLGRYYSAGLKISF